MAEHAGVSWKTVSRFINDEPGVAEATAARVAAAIETLGYERNDLAASLRQGSSSGTFGLVIEDVANPFYSVIVQAVETAARARKLLLITASAREDPVRERELVTALLRRRVEGLLVVPTGPDHRYVMAGGARVGTVFLDRPPGMIDADTVLIDNRGGAQAGVEHLLAHGHRRIALVADTPDLFTARERLVGYRAALEGAGVTEDPGLIRTGNESALAAEAAVEDLLSLPADRRPTALLAANNRCTVGAVRALTHRKRPPALVGFDDFELADVLRITVLHSDPRLLGEQGAARAFARMDGDHGPPQHLVVPTMLIPRGSGEIAP